MDSLGPANFTVIERLSSLRGKSMLPWTTEITLYREVDFILREVPLYTHTHITNGYRLIDG